MNSIFISTPTVRSLYAEMIFNDAVLSTCTVFLLEYDNEIFLITNRHNVTGKDNNTNECLSNTCAIPNKIRVYHYANDTLDTHLDHWITYDYELYNNEIPIWIEHPTLKNRADVIAIKINRHENIKYYSYKLNFKSNIRLVPTDKVSVVGFPFGKKSNAFLPIYNSGTLASEIDLGYDGLAIFLIDMRSRPGQSGSPVIFFQNGGTVNLKDGSVSVRTGESLELLGIYSGRISSESDIGMVWHKQIIYEIISSN